MNADSNPGATLQLERNFEAFKEKLPELLATHAGKLAVMHDAEIIDFFDSYADAVRYGQSRFGSLGNFSVQEVTNRVISLGFYSCAVHNVSERPGRAAC